MTRAFDKVLVANRGEIAVRIIRTLRDMGISSVAIYSDVDRAAQHVRLADEAYPVGEAPPAESYLRGDRILEACRLARADAVHPGYGFLSEDAAFARACEGAGVTFIGPPADAIEVMGHKSRARTTVAEAGVPTVPGTDVGSLEELRQAAAGIGYPVLIKPAAGGGGKGMRRVSRPEEFADAYARARSEAGSSFSDDGVYLEKAIERPRHVEIQVLADAHGSILHLFERDCSIQRRHQKIVEETPSPAPSATAPVLTKMYKVACDAARAVGYRSAGTVEFLLDESGAFYFLEMNTRLQVEHPITELVTGIDLVQQQVRIAAGEPLGFGQADLARTGHAIECRIYAEDPATGFLPSPGPVRLFRAPAGPGVRNDAGVYEGGEVSSYYDPLISKLCAWGSDRSQALARMERALHEYVVLGLATNLPFHVALLQHEEFQKGLYDTDFVDDHPELRRLPAPAPDATALLAGGAVAQALVDEGIALSATPPEAPQPTGSSPISPWRRVLLAQQR